MPPISWYPLYLSMKVAFLATLLSMLIGVPLAWLLARRKLPVPDVLGGLLTLPMLLPPTVLGYYLLVLIGRQTLFGKLWETWFGGPLVFTWQAAVLAASLVAVPLLVRSAQAGFETVDPRLEAVARTLGRSEAAVFCTVAVPLAWRGILAGMVLAFARAMGEFGATLMVAGNIPGQTQTLSIAIYDAVQAGNTTLANTLVVVISVITVMVLFLLNRLTKPVRW